MQRSARPKSAKGKPRPAPPNQPRPQGSTSSGRPTLRGRGTTLRRSGALTNAAYVTTEQVKAEKSRESDAQAIDPSQLPEVARPVSSLTKYRILPKIPQTPDRGDRTSPAESEIELDLMSSFAQQMILDSTRVNGQKPVIEDKKARTEANNPSTSYATRSRVNNRMRRQNDSVVQESPEHKKFRSSMTKSVFPQKNVTAAKRAPLGTKIIPEPKEGEPRIKLALILPDSKRIERFFAPTNSVNDIMQFVKTKMTIPISECNVFSMLQVPKVLLKDWKLSLEEHGISNRTVLYIEEKD